MNAKSTLDVMFKGEIASLTYNMKWGVLRAEWEYRKSQDPSEKSNKAHRL